MLVDIQYERNDIDFHRGTFRVRGDVVEVFPAYEAETAVRIEFFGDEIEAIREVDPLRGKVKGNARPLRDLPGLALRHAAGADAQARSRRSARSSASGSTSSTRRCASSRSSASSSAPSTTSR